MRWNRKNSAALPFPWRSSPWVIVGVITTGGFFMARQEGRIGTASEHAGMAFYLTEQGLVDVMDNWEPTLFGALPAWGDTTFTQAYPGVGLVTARITRMTDLLYFVDVDGTVTRGGAMLSGASRRVGMTVRLVSADIAPPAALTTRGPTELRGTAEVTRRGRHALWLGTRLPRPAGWTSRGSSRTMPARSR